MRFLVAIDGSEQSDRALEHAMDVGVPKRDTLTVVHAVDPDVYSEGGTEPISDLSDAQQRLVIESVEDAERRGEDLLEEAVERAGGRGWDATAELLHGEPVEEIGRYASEAGFDGVFVGHRGLSERAEWVLGSVAKGMVERATVPVTVVR